MHLLHVLVEEVGILHEAFEFLYAIQEAPCNFARHFTVNVMNREVNGIADELKPLAAVLHSIQLFQVDFWESDHLHVCKWLLRGLRLLGWIGSTGSSGERSDR